MSDSELATAIATALGWKNIQHNPMYPGYPNKLAGYRGNDRSALLGIPDYIRDLNACAEFEKTLDDKDVDTRSRYLDYLALECDWPETKNAAELRFETNYLSVRADARQRCLAFLRALNLYTESPNVETKE
jgi:hypothetical protein